VVHSRIIDLDGKETVLDFGHEGVLYRQSFIMYDKQTDTKWNHSTGLAMAGRLTGRRLELLPSRVARWGQRKSVHPETKVLAREGRGGFMGSYVADRDPESFGVSVGQGPLAKLYPYGMLARRPVLNDAVSPFDLVVVFDPATHEAMVFSRAVDRRTLSFAAVAERRDERLLMRDRETGSLWDRLAGKVLEGPLRGKSLAPLVAVPWLRERWRQIYPQGLIYDGDR